MSLEETIQLLVKYRVLRFKGAIDGPPRPPADGATPRIHFDREVLELELHPLAFSSETPDTGAGLKGDVADVKCNCGHTISEHSQDGLCLHACTTDACGLGAAHT